MAWLELHQAIWTHRKTFELAALLRLDETYAAAHVIRLWTWALDNAPSGDLSPLSDRAIAYGAGWRGDPGAFMAALVEAGWLDGRTIHDWYDYAGRLIERRRAEAFRKAKSRAGTAPARGASGGHPAPPDSTGPDSTGPDSTTLPPTPSPLRGEGAGSHRGGRTTNGQQATHSTRELAQGKLEAGSPAGLAPPTSEDVALWNLARAAVMAGLSPGNAEQLAGLEPLGRDADGGLRLRAPPGLGLASRFRGAVAHALADAGDDSARNVRILE